ncbi:MAG: sugar phosphate nucleotidyltransferase [Sumerlaeia bacterium]
MKGIVLATQSRAAKCAFAPLSTITSRYLLPVFDRPMVFWALAAVAEAGATEILLVVDPAFHQDFETAAAAFESPVPIQIVVREGGQLALDAARPHAESEPCVVLLADNLFESSLAAARAQFDEAGGGALVLLEQSPDLTRFGVAKIENGHIVRIEEKPSRPLSQYAVAGAYFYDATFWSKLTQARHCLSESSDLTAVNNLYAEEGQLRHAVLPGWWTDVGDYQSLLLASVQAAERERARRAPLHTAQGYATRSEDD